MRNNHEQQKSQEEIASEEMSSRFFRSPREIRDEMGLTQGDFAEVLGVSVRTVQDWEQGRRSPRGPAQKLLQIADRHPEVL